MKIYDKKELLRKEFKILQKEYLSCCNFHKFCKLREREEKIYKKYLFYKNYLIAERKIKK